MKKIRSFYHLLSNLSGGRWGIILISSILPVLLMALFGLFLAFKYGYVLELSIAIAVSTLVTTIPLFLLSRVSDRESQDAVESALNENGLVGEEVGDGLVKASSEWSQAELVIWNQAKLHNREHLKTDIDWVNLDKVGIEILEFVAKEFGKKTLDFSIPEGLKLFEEVGLRYKRVVKENIPGIEYLKLSYIKAGYEAYDKYGELGQKIVKAAMWANHAKNLYYNPLKVVSDLSREQATSSMTKGVVEDMQQVAKEALLDEIAAVAIDLYSGRFSLEEDDLQITDASKLDEKRFAVELEPVRVVLVGQTSSGKSSIVNILKNEMVAEVDVLPSTDASTVYSAEVDDNEVRVIDLKGLDGTEKTEKAMLQEMTQADLVLWILKANQPARDLDKKLKDKFDGFYADPKNVSRKKPKLLAVVNQVDNLKPLTEWEPPFNLVNPISAKEKVIAQALQYNQELLLTDGALPLSISPERAHFGVDTLKETIVNEISEANNVQRNRQRTEAMKRGTSIKKQFNRMAKVSKKVAPEALKKAPEALKVASPKIAEIVIKKVIK
ncbi:GTPase family protein [Vibrio gallaecicus]|uniref:GTPase family protein n=1 Tax=Vibrio gallaecicus TaxID=552386 RepID=UPI0010C96241|nr:GTPase [Vibrio gallaecicus]MDN3617597.1 50S ribosome-binding GTPase [Vibrio gallaecicus]